MNENKKAEILQGMFSGATFYKSVVAGVVEAGATLSYQEESGHVEGTKVATGKESIIEYVDRLKPIVKPELLEEYDALWMQILELEEVKSNVYNKGKQQDTTFNRNLVAQIIHQIGDRVYFAGINVQQYAEYLEPGKGKDHSVRQQLGLLPDIPIKKAIERFLKKE